ncbi:hypothetical protein ACHJH3_06650 [Campylobacter sp. MOP7]|uniref:hypothetical protein n=1 Tax=Campylobacter canis TaxID=3378588 RepID=UPI00387E9881
MDKTKFDDLKPAFSGVYSELDRIKFEARKRLFEIFNERVLSDDKEASQFKYLLDLLKRENFTPVAMHVSFCLVPLDNLEQDEAMVQIQMINFVNSDLDRRCVVLWHSEQAKDLLQCDFNNNLLNLLSNEDCSSFVIDTALDHFIASLCDYQYKMRDMLLDVEICKAEYLVLPDDE